MSPLLSVPQFLTAALWFSSRHLCLVVRGAGCVCIVLQQMPCNNLPSNECTPLSSPTSNIWKPCLPKSCQSCHTLGLDFHSEFVAVAGWRSPVLSVRGWDWPRWLLSSIWSPVFNAQVVTLPPAPETKEMAWAGRLGLSLKQAKRLAADWPYSTSVIVSSRSGVCAPSTSCPALGKSFLRQDWNPGFHGESFDT